MSLTFAEVWRDSGVDEGNKSHPTAMMVAAAGANLVMLKGAGADLRFKPDSHFKVKEITSSSSRGMKTAKREVPELSMRSKSEDAAGLFALIPIFGEMIGETFAKEMPDRKLGDALSSAKAQSARLLLVEGVRRGLGRLSVKSGTEETSIQVWVREAKPMLVSFHFVQDLGPDGKPRERSAWSVASASYWTGLLNNIYTPQTNITFKLHTAGPFPIKQSLPTRLDLKQWQALNINPSAGAAVNIFLVGEWIGEGTDPLGSFIKATKHIVVDDRKTHDEIVTTMAHELGHFLGVSVNFGHPDAGEKHFLMTTVDWRQGAHIPQGYAQHFNPI